MKTTKERSHKVTSSPKHASGQTNMTKRRRVGGRSRRVQDAVFAATIQVLLEHGYEGFRIAEVAERAGVNETSIYRRWGNKELLLIEALVSRAEADLAIPNRGSLRSDLIAFLNEARGFLQTPVGIALIHFGAYSLSRPELSGYHRKFWEMRSARIRSIFERAIARGEISAGVDIPFMLELLIGPIYARMLLTNQTLNREFTERTVDIVLRGFSKKLSPSL